MDKATIRAGIVIAYFMACLGGFGWIVSFTGNLICDNTEGLL